MPQERRNHYRVLYVQPEAPLEVIQAAYRALTALLRLNPDAERAAAMQEAVAVLADPARRAAYDRTLQRPQVGGAVPARGCPFCGHPVPSLVQRDTRCDGCDSPLHPAPDPDRHAGSELQGRRRGERFGHALALQVHLPGVAGTMPAQLRDLSLGGLSFHFDRTLPDASVLRVQAPGFDALAEVAQCRTTPAGTTVHARLLTLQMTRGPRGAVLDARA